MNGELLTIPSGIQDPSYRYKMPKMKLRNESKGNGIKTNIVNIGDVAFALRVPVLSIMKYLSQVLGANIELESILKGDHQYSQLLKHLDDFIKKYVCCSGCNYPELAHFVEGKDLKSKCNSCGKTNSHDAIQKAGKALYQHVKAGKGMVKDITRNDDKQGQEDAEAKKKDKKDKKDKKKKKNKEGSDSELAEEEEDLTDVEEPVSLESKRVSKVIGMI